MDAWAIWDRKLKTFVRAVGFRTDGSTFTAPIYATLENIQGALDVMKSKRFIAVPLPMTG